MKTGKEYWNLKIADTKELFKKRPAWMGGYDGDYPSAAFIRGLISDYKPVNMLEVGTAAGWAAYYMLEEAHKYSDVAGLTSIDCADRVYYDREKETGAAFFETDRELAKFWDLRINILLADYVQSCGEKFDFVFIDANHSHPWAALDLLCVLPYVTDDSVIVFHDVFLNRIAKGEMSSYLHPEGVVSGCEQYFGPNRVYSVFSDRMVLSYDDIAPNCAAILFGNLSLEKILEALDSQWEQDIFSAVKYDEFIRIFEKIKRCINIFAGEEYVQKLDEILHRRLDEAYEKVIEKTKSAADFVNKIIKNKKTVLYGASKFLEDALNSGFIDVKNVIGIVDADLKKQGKFLGGVEIFLPDKLKELEPEIIFSCVITKPRMKFHIEKVLSECGTGSDIDINDDLFEFFISDNRF